MRQRDRIGRAEIEALEAATGKVVTDTAAQAAPPLVYHYASLDVAVKILDTFEMWCTNVRFSTDKTEGVHGEGIIDGVCRTDQDLLMQGARDLVAETIDGYAACFSVDRDELTKWDSYASGGHGVSIGVDVDVLSKRTHVAFCRVEYDVVRQSKVTKDLLNLFRGRMLSAKTWHPRLRRLAYVLTLSFVVLRGRLKASSYQTEREYRLLDALPRDATKHNTKLEYFQRGPDTVPFFRVDLRDSTAEGSTQPIREVRVGPCMDFSTAEAKIRNTVAYRTRAFPILRSQVAMKCD